MFERESRREKIIEGKMREIRLRVKTRQSEAHSTSSKDNRPSVQTLSAADALLRTAETDFLSIIEAEEKKALVVEGAEETTETTEDETNKPPTKDALPPN
uniref:Uncharacterized protein n=2 Tax=Clastoptera arizonana TaxID=38151 RepID=A0A1B6DTQ3_9HEMI